MYLLRNGRVISGSNIFDFLEISSVGSMIPESLNDVPDVIQIRLQIVLRIYNNVRHGIHDRAIALPNYDRLSMVRTALNCIKRPTASRRCGPAHQIVRMMR
ncbi:MAG TPA: hypothetical protein VFR24_17345 [Candidatus Angelobacter sp.]|nr:hypothetical protein [Candidatus Angelobacter sp.]